MRRDVVHSVAYDKNAIKNDIFADTVVKIPSIHKIWEKFAPRY